MKAGRGVMATASTYAIAVVVLCLADGSRVGLAGASDFDGGSAFRETGGRIRLGMIRSLGG